LDRDNVFKIINEHWQLFLSSDLPKLKSAVTGLFPKQPSG
jgi:hypothetical protein